MEFDDYNPENDAERWVETHWDCDGQVFTRWNPDRDEEVDIIDELVKYAEQVNAVGIGDDGDGNAQRFEVHRAFRFPDGSMWVFYGDACWDLADANGVTSSSTAIIKA